MPQSNRGGRAAPRHAQPHTTPHEERDRVAQMGGSRARDSGTTAGLARRLAGYGGSLGGVKSRGKSTFKGGVGRIILRTAAHAQRVVVKTHYVKHPRTAGGTRAASGAARTSGALGAHAGYLARESASLNGERGAFYDAQHEGINPGPVVKDWTQDRHHFRVIVSPEHAAELADFKAYVREVVSRWEADMDLPKGGLDWLAINHHNTDNPHAHVLIRGSRPYPDAEHDPQRRRDLVIARHYIGHGMRDRAREVATELLGPRNDQEIRQGLTQELRAERFTALDRMIQRAVEPVDGALTFDASKSRPVGFRDEHRDLVVGRLAVLKQMGMARSPDEVRRRFGPSSWVLEPGWSMQLEDLGARRDVIRQLYQTLGSDAAKLASRVERMTAVAAKVAPVSGVVVALGSIEPEGTPGSFAGIGSGSGRADSFLVVRDAGGRLHHAPVRGDAELGATRVGSVVELGRNRAQRDRMIAAIVEVAGQHDGLYRAADHERLLAVTRPDFAAGDRGPFVASHVKRLESLARAERSGVTREPEDEKDSGGDFRGQFRGVFQVDLDRLQRFHERTQRGPWARVDLHVLSSATLEQQTTTLAATWLDRRLYERQRAAKDGKAVEPWGNDVEQALESRASWLVDQGYATAGPPWRFASQALRRLGEIEATTTRQQLAAETGREVSALHQGQSITGHYLAVRHLHQGRLAVIETPTGLVVAPVLKAPPLTLGTPVRAERVNDRMTVLTQQKSSDRTATRDVQRRERSGDRSGRQEELER
jgi:type IV secretory pathway VirD2 relaxase